MPRLIFMITALSPAVAAVLGYWISYEYLCWNVPRRKPLLPSMLIALAASYLVYWSMTLLGNRFDDVPMLILVFLTSLAGVVAALYVAVKIGTPAHATVAIVCDKVGVPNQVDDDGRASSSDDREGALRIFRKGRGLEHPAPPTVWPDYFFVAQEGSVSWILYGEPGTKVRILFNKGWDPFAVTEKDRPSQFIGIVPGSRGMPEIDEDDQNIRLPGIIVAGPAVRGGRGNYSIIVTYPNGTEKTIDPGGAGPSKHA